MTFQDFPNTQSDHSVTQELFLCGLFWKLSKTSVSIKISVKRRVFTVVRLRADLLFFETKSIIHGVCSVLSLYAAFAFQNCSYGVQELKGKHALRKIEIIYVWQFVSSEAQKRNFVDVIDWSNIDNAFK